MMYRTKNISLAFILVAILITSGCDTKLKQEISEYKGDGNIAYFKAQLLGSSGVYIREPSFDLSKELDVEYKLTGIPKKTKYGVYLVVPEPCPIDSVLKGYFELQICKNNILVKKLIAPTLDKMTNSVGGGENRFYFYKDGQFDVDEVVGDWSIKIKSINKKLPEKVNAYILISAGGYK